MSTRSKMIYLAGCMSYFYKNNEMDGIFYKIGSDRGVTNTVKYIVETKGSKK